MNKHQYTAISLSVVAIFSSFLFWTSHLGRLPLPQIPAHVVTDFRSSLEDWFGEGESEPVVRVRETTVEDLGAHFATQIQKTHITASLVQNEKREPIAKQEPVVKHEDAVPEISEEPEQKPEINPEDTPVHAAADELAQWQLSPVWTVSIPSLGIRAPVMLPSMVNWSARAWDLLEEQMQVGLNHGAVAYPHSSAPGSIGNLILAGHSSPPNAYAEQSAYGSLFAKLPDIAIGEEINVSSATYRVEEKIIVSPEEVSILEQQDDESILKLITCYPVGTTRDRMIVLARKVE